MEIKNLLSLTCILFITILSSCNEKEKNTDKVIQMMSTELSAVSEEIEWDNESLYKKMESKLYDPLTAEKATIWNAKAEAVRKEIKTVVNYLQTQRQIKNKNWDSIDFRIKRGGLQLREIDPELKIIFKDDIYDFVTSLSFTKNLISFFRENNTNVEESMLNKIECNARRIEHKVLMFCDMKSTPIQCMRFEKTGILLGQNTTHLRKGDQLVISAGIGEFKLSANPQMTVDGYKMEITDAFGTYKTVIHESPGRHSKKIVIKYTTENGERKKEEKEVEYTVDKD